MTKDNVLQQCTIEGNVVKLPDEQLGGCIITIQKDL